MFVDIVIVFEAPRGISLSYVGPLSRFMLLENSSHAALRHADLGDPAEMLNRLAGCLDASQIAGDWSVLPAAWRRARLTGVWNPNCAVLVEQKRPSEGLPNLTIRYRTR